MAEQKKKDAGAGEVQDNFDEAAEKGYFGAKADPTPNEHYTLDGVTSGKPTPETDGKAAKAADEHQARLASKFGTGE